MMEKMLERMLGAAQLKADTFEDVEHDRSATLQAMLVVILVSISSGVGGLLQDIINEDEISVVNALVFGVIGGVVSWAVWALGTWIIGSTILKTADTEGRLGAARPGHRIRASPWDFLIPRLYTVCWVVDCACNLHLEIRRNAYRRSPVLGLHFYVAGVFRGPYRGDSLAHHIWDSGCAPGHWRLTNRQESSHPHLDKRRGMNFETDSETASIQAGGVFRVLELDMLDGIAGAVCYYWRRGYWIVDRGRVRARRAGDGRGGGAGSGRCRSPGTAGPHRIFLRSNT